MGHAYQRVVPRWEWRTFGEGFGEAESRLTRLPPERTQDSDETYLLSREGIASIKVRDALMDVKLRERVAGDGLEQWRPVMKAEFPLPAADVSEVMRFLGATAPLVRAEYESDQLIEEVFSPNPDLVAVKLHKRRAHYTVSGCMAELSEIRTGRAASKTICIEDPDPARVRAVVHELGLSSRPNVSVPRGLLSLVGLRARRYAVIDVGTNSVKFHIGELAGGAWRTIVDRAEVTRLGEGLAADGKFGERPIERTADAIAAMAAEARRNGVDVIAAVGTAGLRLASNSATLLKAVQERAQVEIEVISGEEESRLGYVAVKSSLGLGPGSLVVFDTGGGSSQFTFGLGDRVDEQFSLNVGAARFTERFQLERAVGADTLALVFEAIDAELGRLDGRPQPDALVGMGGAVTNLTAVKLELATYDPESVQGTTLDLAEIDRQIELYRARSAEQRRDVIGLQPGRAEVILAGACIVRSVIAKLGCRSLAVSDRGVRHGLLVERFG